MKFFRIGLFLLIIPLGVNAQTYRWVGKVMDEKTKLPIDKTNFALSNTNKIFSSNKQGEFEISFSFDSIDEIQIDITNIAYQDRVIRLHRADFTNFVLSENIFLTPQIYTFPDIDITRKVVVPDTIFGLPTYNVGDFCFVGNQLLLLTYTKEKHWKKAKDRDKTHYEGCQLQLLDANYHKINSISLNGLYNRIYTQYLDEVFLTSPTTNYRVTLDNNEILLDSIDLTSFQDYIEPVIDSMDNQIIATTFNPQIPAFEYYSFDLRDSTYQTIHRVEDEEVLSVFRSEYKYLDGRGKLNAVRYEQKTGVDKEIVAAFMSGFANSMFVKPLYAPAFTVEDTLIVFDHYRDKIFRFDNHRNVIDSVAINYHKDKPFRWKKKILRDQVTGKFYALLEKNGYSYLFQINTNTGEIDQQFKLYFRYVDRIRIENNEVFYIYRPFESSQKKFLYSEKI